MTPCLHSHTPQSRFLKVRHLRLHYLEWGTSTNPPLLLLHGGAAHAHWWDHIATDFAQEYHVLALDLRGHGESSQVTPPAYEIDDYVADLQEFITTLNLAPLILLGHSLGGFVALTYATRYASTLSGLVVVDIGSRSQSGRRMQLLRRLPHPIYRNEEDLLHRFRLLPNETRAAPEVLHYLARQSVRPLENGTLTLKFDRATLIREPTDLSSRLANITCPALFLRGSDSQSLSVQTLVTMVACCPRARGAEISHAGHHVFLDNPAAFVDIVRSFLRAERESTSCKT